MFGTTSSKQTRNFLPAALQQLVVAREDMRVNGSLRKSSIPSNRPRVEISWCCYITQMDSFVWLREIYIGSFLYSFPHKIHVSSNSFLNSFLKTFWLRQQGTFPSTGTTFKRMHWLTQLLKYAWSMRCWMAILLHEACIFWLNKYLHTSPKNIFQGWFHLIWKPLIYIWYTNFPPILWDSPPVKLWNFPPRSSNAKTTALLQTVSSKWHPVLMKNL